VRRGGATPAEFEERRQVLAGVMAAARAAIRPGSTAQAP
jgi:hypothetical protein